MTSTTDYAVRREPLDLELLPSATGSAATALERQRPGGLPYREYFGFLKQFSRTEEQLRVLPLSTGPRFTLD